MCLFCAVANYIWIQQTGKDHYYLALDVYVEGNWENPVAQICLTFLTFWILLSYLVPISLFVTLEIVKFWQVSGLWDGEGGGHGGQRCGAARLLVSALWPSPHPRPTHPTLDRALCLSTLTATCATPRPASGRAAATPTSMRTWARCGAGTDAVGVDVCTCCCACCTSPGPAACHPLPGPATLCPYPPTPPPQVEYIFSDKTGTMTSNEMQLREIAVKGVAYGTSEVRLEENADRTGLNALRLFDQRLYKAAAKVQRSSSWSGLVSAGGSRRDVMAVSAGRLGGQGPRVAPAAGGAAGSWQPLPTAHSHRPPPCPAPPGCSTPPPTPTSTPRARWASVMRRWSRRCRAQTRAAAASRLVRRWRVRRGSSGPRQGGGRGSRGAAPVGSCGPASLAPLAPRPLPPLQALATTGRRAAPRWATT